MPALPPFKIERWMDEYETKCTHNLAETCSDSISLEELAAFAQTDNVLDKVQRQQRLTYGHIKGSPELRTAIASLYGTELLSPDKILVTQGAIAANYLVLSTLIKAGDHVVCLHPTYQQLWEVPRSLGAAVDLWLLHPEKGWKPDVTELTALLRKETKLVIINNPNNPTGQAFDSATLHEVVRAVKTCAPGCLILSDEVYRPMFHSTPTPPSALELDCDSVIVTGSLSKAWSLAGLRLGWIVTPRADLIDLFSGNRDYTTISVSMLDDAVAAKALRADVRQKIIQRNLQLAKTNLSILNAWVDEHQGDVAWTPPVSGTTAFIKLPDRFNDEEDFCRRLCTEAGVLVGPGRCFDWPGWIRIGYVCDTDTLRQGLTIMSAFLKGDTSARA